MQALSPCLSPLPGPRVLCVARRLRAALRRNRRQRVRGPPPAGCGSSAGRTGRTTWNGPRAMLRDLHRAHRRCCGGFRGQRCHSAAQGIRPRPRCGCGGAVGVGAAFGAGNYCIGAQPSALGGSGGRHRRQPAARRGASVLQPLVACPWRPRARPRRCGRNFFPGATTRLLCFQVAALLLQAGADPRARLRNGMTALQLLEGFAGAEGSQGLLPQGVDPVSAGLVSAGEGPVTTERRLEGGRAALRRLDGGRAALRRLLLRDGGDG